MDTRVELTSCREEDAGADAAEAIVAPPPDEPDRAPPARQRGARREERAAVDARRRERVRSWVLDQMASGEASHSEALVDLAARTLRLRVTPWLRAVVEATVAGRPAPDRTTVQPAAATPMRSEPRRAGRRGKGTGACGPTSVRSDPALPEDPVLLPLDPPTGAGPDESVEARAVRTLRARLTAGQVVWVAPAGGVGNGRRYRLFAASPRGYTNISQVAAAALGLDRHLARGGTAIATDRPPAELVAALARRVRLDGALVCRWT